MAGAGGAPLSTRSRHASWNLNFALFFGRTYTHTHTLELSLTFISQTTPKEKRAFLQKIKLTNYRERSKKILVSSSRDRDFFLWRVKCKVCTLCIHLLVADSNYFIQRRKKTWVVYAAKILRRDLRLFSLFLVVVVVVWLFSIWHTNKSLIMLKLNVNAITLYAKIHLFCLSLGEGEWLKPSKESFYRNALHGRSISGQPMSNVKRSFSLWLMQTRYKFLPQQIIQTSLISCNWILYLD